MIFLEREVFIMKSNWNHLSEADRKVIASGLSQGKKLCDIALSLGFDPTSISKEVKRNRIVWKNRGLPPCPKLARWPFVCTTCNKRYEKSCRYEKFKYDARIAENKAFVNLVNTRKGIDITKEELENLDNLISQGIALGQSIDEIKTRNNISKATSTLYSYTHKGILSIKPKDLPYAGKLKPRKHSKAYDYPQNNKINRLGHTYPDYILFMKSHPFYNQWQLDFLGHKKGDRNAILSMIMPEFQFPLIDMIKSPNSQKVVEYFDLLELKLGSRKFAEIFQVILTDRDPCFSDIEGLVTSKITGKKRFELFFCDPYVSTQKPHVENLNKQLRRYFPKNKSSDLYTLDYIKSTNETLIYKPKRSLDNFTPKELFVKHFGQDAFDKLI